MSLLKKVFKGVKKAASVANPLFGAAYDAIGGKKPSQIGKNYVTNNLEGAAAAGAGALGAAALPALSGGAGATGAGGAATAAGAASNMGILGKIGKVATSPLGQGLLDFGGSVISGIGQGKQAAEDRGEQRREYDLDYGLKKQQADAEAADRQRKLQGLQTTTPIRQDIMAMIAQRLGLPAGGAAQPPMAPMQAPPPASVGNVPPVRPAAMNAQQSGQQIDPQMLQAILQRMRQVF